jgi:hypothetical protein
MVEGTDASVNRAGGAPAATAPAKRLLKADDGCKDRVRGAGDAGENRSPNEEGTDARVVSEALSVAQRDSNVALLGLANRAGGALGTSAGRTAVP